jgi:outer membrane protein assembly factor BamD
MRVSTIENPFMRCGLFVGLFILILSSLRTPSHGELPLAQGEIIAESTGDEEQTNSSICELLALGDQRREAGKIKAAIKTYRSLARRFPCSKEAPIALQYCGEIYRDQHRFQKAFAICQKILERYPDYANYDDVIALEFDIARRLMEGERNYFFGKIPGFRDRDCAIRFFQKITQQVPYGDRTPKALMHIANLGIRVKDSTISIDALERLIDEHASTEYAPQAHLMLAQVHRSLVKGPAYDQKMTENAINYFREFLILYPESPFVSLAEEGLNEAKNLLAASKLAMGNFYYDDRQNSTAARIYYEEVIALAPQSPASAEAEKRLQEIAENRPGKGSPIDCLIGRYRQSSTGTLVESTMTVKE